MKSTSTLHEIGGIRLLSLEFVNVWSVEDNSNLRSFKLNFLRNRVTPAKTIVAGPVASLNRI
jgi:hypothetical protein